MAITHDYVTRFLRARESCDPAVMDAFLHDDIDWLLSGPVDVLPHCGARKGKTAVLDLFCRVAPAAIETFKYNVDHLLVNGDYAATMSRVQITQASTGRAISYRSAYFMRFSGGKLIWFRGLIDSFSAAEQFMGHALDLDHAPEIVSLAPNGDLVEI